MTASSHLQGVLAPVLTPMHDDLSPDTAKWIAFCQQLLADGCTGLAPFGTTSEANSLALDERMEMLAALAASIATASSSTSASLRPSRNSSARRTLAR